MPQLVEKLLAYADTYGSLIPLIIIFIVFSKKKMPLVIRLLSWYLLFSFLLFGISNYLADKGINNLFIYHLFAVLEFLFLALIFREIIENILVKRRVIYIIVIFCFLAVLNVFLFEKLNTLNSNIAAIEFLILIILALIYYFELSNSDKILLFQRNPYFWIVSAFFIYFTSCILIFALYKYAAKTNRSFTLDFWLIQVAMYIIKNLVLSKGILCFKYNK
jgi:hypothetical protein